MTRSMYDAAYPPADPHLDVCAFYIGGDTPYVWSDAEIAAQAARWRLPIFTRSNPIDAAQAASDAGKAVAWLRARAVPLGSAVALDYETAINAAYVAEFDHVLVGAGYATLLYGSKSTVTQNPRPSAGYWTASWNGIAHLDTGAAATQWASDTMLGKPYDLSEVADSLVLWDTQGAQMEQTDKVIGNLSRGNTVGDVLADLSNLRDELYLAAGTDSNNPPPAGSRLAIVLSQIADIHTKVTALAVPDPAAFVAALVANPDAITKFAQAVAAALPAPATADQIATAEAKHLGADLAQG